MRRGKMTLMPERSRAMYSMPTSYVHLEQAAGAKAKGVKYAAAPMGTPKLSSCYPTTDIVSR